MKFRMGARIGMSKTMDFLVLMANWFFFGWLFRTQQTDPALFQAWIFLATLFSMLALTAIDYFDRHIPQPEFSGVLSLLFALPLSAFVAKWMLMLSSHIPPIRYLEAFKASLGVAITFELLQVATFSIQRSLGRKWTLVTHLHPDELMALEQQVELSGASRWIQIFPDSKLLSNGGFHGDETLVISRKAVRHLKDHPELLAAHLRGQRILDVRQLLKEFRGRVNLHNSDGWSFLLGSTYQSFPIRFYFYVKGILEVFLAVILLILLSPLFLALSLGILFSIGSPIFYSQTRLGYRGRQFSLYKFRSMTQTAEQNGAQWAKEDDPRVTPFGRWLRKTRMDELPQLLNVILGDLSFVGPRPERPEFYKLLSDRIPLFSTRLLVRPGITGWAQVRQGYASSVEESKIKLEYDLYYVQNMSPRLDARVMIQTAALMIRGNSGR